MAAGKLGALTGRQPDDEPAAGDGDISPRRRPARAAAAVPAATAEVLPVFCKRLLRLCANMCTPVDVHVPEVVWRCAGGGPTV